MRPLPVSIRMSEVLSRLYADLTGEAPRLVPLSLSLDWARGNPKLSRLGAPREALVGRLRRQLAGAEARAKSEERNQAETEYQT